MSSPTLIRTRQKFSNLCLNCRSVLSDNYERFRGVVQQKLPTVAAWRKHDPVVLILGNRDNLNDPSFTTGKCSAQRDWLSTRAVSASLDIYARVNPPGRTEDRSSDRVPDRMVISADNLYRGFYQLLIFFVNVQGLHTTIYSPGRVPTMAIPAASA